MESEPPAEGLRERPFNWTWVLIIAVWLLLFVLVLGVGGAIVFWRQAANAKYASAAITAEYQGLNDQVTASGAKAATLTKDRSALVEQLAAANKQLAAAGNAPDAAVAKLTSERNALADQLATTNTNVAKLIAERDVLSQRLAAVQAAQIAAPGPGPAAQPGVANAPVVPPAIAARPPSVPAAPIPAVFPPKRPPVTFIPGVTLPLAAQADQLAKVFDDLARNDPNGGDLQEAAKLFDNPPASRRGGTLAYHPGIQIIRQHRSVSAVPLLLKDAIKPSNLNTLDPSQYADAVILLTGEIPDLNDPLDWWGKNKPTLTVDVTKMTEAQQRRIAAVLVREIENDRRRYGSGISISAHDAENSLHLLDLEKHVLSSIRPGLNTKIYPGEVRSAMIPMLLESAGWVKNPPANPPANSVIIPLEIVPVVALLRKDRAAPDLDKIALDPRQCGAARLTCLIAMYMAGEDMNDDALISIADNEKLLSTRLLAVTAMQFCNTQKISADLLKQLADPNEEIIAAACTALQQNPSPEAVPLLRKIVGNTSMKHALTPAFRALGKIKTRASGDTLADYLRARLQKGTVDSTIYDSLNAFSAVSGFPHHTGELKTQDIIDALAWWQAHKKDLQ